MARASSPKTDSAMSREERVSVTVRKIDNGYIVSHSVDGPKGLSSTETYHATKPAIDIAKPEGKKVRDT